MREVRVRFCPDGRSTFDETVTFTDLPRRGETILWGPEEDRYVVVDIDWQLNGHPFLIAHAFTRPRAVALTG